MTSLKLRGIRYQSDTNLTTILPYFTYHFPRIFPMDFPMDFPASKGDQGLTTPSSPKSSRGGRMRHRLPKSVRHPGMGVLLGIFLNRKPWVFTKFPYGSKYHWIGLRENLQETMGFYQIYRVLVPPSDVCWFITPLTSSLYLP